MKAEVEAETEETGKEAGKETGKAEEGDKKPERLYRQLKAMGCQYYTSHFAQFVVENNLLGFD